MVGADVIKSVVSGAANVAGGVMGALVAEDVAKWQAKGRIESAKSEERHKKHAATMAGAAQVLSVSDRPFCDIEFEVGPGLTTHWNVSLMTLHGLLALQDIREQYQLRRAKREEDVRHMLAMDGELDETYFDDAMENNIIMQALLGIIPVEHNSISSLAGIFDTINHGGSVPIERGPRPLAVYTSSMVEGAVQTEASKIAQAEWDAGQ